MEKKFRLGLVLGSRSVTKYIAGIIRWTQSRPGLDVTLLLLPPKPLNHSSAKQRLAKSLFEQLVSLETLLLNRINHHRGHYELQNIATVAPGLLCIELANSLEKDIADCVVSLDLDLLVDCQPGARHESIAKLSRLGLLSLCYEEESSSGTNPPGFAEVLARQDFSGFSIRHFSPSGEESMVLTGGRFTTQWYASLNQANLFLKSHHYLKVCIGQIADSDKIIPMNSNRTSYHTSDVTHPNLLDLSRNALVTGFTFTRKTAEKFLGKGERWGVAYSKTGWKTAVLAQGNRLPAPPNRFLADPFCFHHNERDYVFVEDYDIPTKRACISAYELTGDGPLRLGPVIVEPFHMSFPNIFRVDAKIYMCPETGQSGQVRLYECTEFPLKWQLSQVLMHNTSGADPLIFRHNGLWWMFLNTDSSDSCDHCSELSIYYADRLNTLDWTPHPKNPVIVDSSRARNGGILLDSDTIYRVSQRHAFDWYGKGFSVNRVDVLTVTDYRETCVRQVNPDFFPEIKGTHHFHSNGHLTAYDYRES